MRCVAWRLGAISARCWLLDVRVCLHLQHVCKNTWYSQRIFRLWSTTHQPLPARPPRICIIALYSASYNTSVMDLVSPRPAPVFLLPLRI
ncbi:hypothetical protein VTK26DRAFT_6733 [Humicola hyalothermophila]